MNNPPSEIRNIRFEFSGFDHPPGISSSSVTKCPKKAQPDKTNEGIPIIIATVLAAMREATTAKRYDATNTIKTIRFRSFINSYSVCICWHFTSTQKLRQDQWITMIWTLAAGIPLVILNDFARGPGRTFRKNFFLLFLSCHLRYNRGRWA